LPRSSTSRKADKSRVIPHQHMRSTASGQAKLEKLGLATYRVTNDEDSADPAAVASNVLKRVCKRRRVLVHTNPAYPFYGWKPCCPARSARDKRVVSTVEASCPDRPGGRPGLKDSEVPCCTEAVR
jgi:hypothetical protein